MKQEEISVGWAMRDVSTEKPVGIRGQFYLRISEGVMDPITVTALALDNGKDNVIFLSCDATTILSPLVKMIRKKILKNDPSVPAEKVIIHATHTHASGDLYNLPDDFPCDLPRMPGDEYQEFFSDMGAEAVVEAWKKRKPGQIAWGFGYAATGYSRRTVYFDNTAERPGNITRAGLFANGHTVMYGNTNDAQFSHFEAGADPFINFLYTFTGEGKLTGVIINVPCPSQCSMHEWRLTADYWHEVRNNIKKQYGNIFILPQCAAAGDLETIVLHYKKAHQRRLELKGTTQRQEIADRITTAFTEVVEWAGKDLRKQVPLVHNVRTVPLTKRRIPEEEYRENAAQLDQLQKEEFAKVGDAKQRLRHDSTLACRRERCQEMIKRYEGQNSEPKLPMELHVVRLGDIAFATNFFEMYMDYMHRIQGQSPATQTFIIQLTGSEDGRNGGYLATERGMQGKGYSATRNMIGPEGGQELVAETIKDLNELWEE